MWSLLSNPKNLLIIILGIAILGLGGTVLVQKAVIATMKYEKVKLENDRQIEIIKIQEKMKAEQKAHDNRVAKLAAEKLKADSLIANLKIEGKCIKNEEYYDIANSVAIRFNNGLLSKPNN